MHKVTCTCTQEDGSSHLHNLLLRLFRMMNSSSLVHRYTGCLNIHADGSNHLYNLLLRLFRLMKSSALEHMVCLSLFKWIQSSAHVNVLFKSLCKWLQSSPMEHMLYKTICTFIKIICTYTHDALISMHIDQVIFTCIYVVFVSMQMYSHLHLYICCLKLYKIGLSHVQFDMCCVNIYADA